MAIITVVHRQTPSKNSGGNIPTIMKEQKE